MWVYLIFAMVVLPTVIPLLIMSVEPREHRWRIMPFAAVGAFVSAVLLETMLRHSPHAAIGSYHLSYSIGLRHAIAVIGLYILATCGPMLVSRNRDLLLLGVVNLVVVGVLARLGADGFASLWCFYAAIVSGFIALRLRRRVSVLSPPQSTAHSVSAQ